MHSTTFDLIVQASSLLAEGMMLDVDDDSALESYLDRVSCWADGTEDQIGALRAFLIKIKSDVDLLRQEEKRLAERRRSMERMSAPIKDQIKTLLEAMELQTGEAKIKRPEFTAYLQRSQKLQAPESVEDWPARFVVMQPRPDRTAAKKAIKAGDTIDGFSIVESRSVVIR